jgi:diguanylate cyclase (GGDEF)-like protein
LPVSFGDVASQPSAKAVLRFLLQIVHPAIRSEEELAAFILRTCVICASVALAVDVINQTVFFESWSASLRSWGVTVVLATAIAFPVSRAIGRAHLALVRAKGEVEILSRTDELTGLLNRRALMEMAVTQPPETMVLVIADIDRFKRVNDNYGHMAGDAVIRMVSRIATSELGDLGALGRLGGEEFALLTSDVSPSLLVLRLENLRTRIALTPVIAEGGAAVHVTISAGVAIRGAGRDLDALYADADRALYDAKKAGRNRIRYSRLFADARGATLAHRAESGRRKSDQAVMDSDEGTSSVA